MSLSLLIALQLSGCVFTKVVSDPTKPPETPIQEPAKPPQPEPQVKTPEQEDSLYSTYTLIKEKTEKSINHIKKNFSSKTEGLTQNLNPAKDMAANSYHQMEAKPAAPVESKAMHAYGAGTAMVGLARGGGAQGKMMPSSAAYYGQPYELSTESYDTINENKFFQCSEKPVSTFSIDVDTASYSNIRRMITQGARPQADAVRIEELINYFDYKYDQPDKGAFAVNLEYASALWNKKHKVVRVGIKGKEIKTEKRPASNLVFLIDVSGSMNSPQKLPLVKSSLRMLVEQLGENDSISLVVYAGAAGLVLPPTTGDKKSKIMTAIDQLEAGGSTNGGQGIQLAYETAKENFIKGGVNRVLLATDGDFNVGVTDRSSLTELVEQNAKKNIYLTILGFGMGNYKDGMMETLSNKGNGNYAYIDNQNEAKKVLVEQMTGTLVTIAKDVKIQIEFNPRLVKAYRLIGYENRLLKNEDFNNDAKDAGDIGAGHTVTALYEIIPQGIEMEKSTDALKYQQVKEASVEKPIASANSDELLTLKIRYKKPDGDVSEKQEFPLKYVSKNFEDSSESFRFASAVALFGMLLRESEFVKDGNYGTVTSVAKKALGEDKNGYRKEFIDLVNQLDGLKLNRQASYSE